MNISHSYKKQFIYVVIQRTYQFNKNYQPNTKEHYRLTGTSKCGS